VTYRRTLFIAATITTAILIGAVTDAHKPITSKYTYHQDVYPIFLNQCGGCHAPDAVAPMSLLTYEDAYPWAQSIKEEVVNLTMPPWQPEYGFGVFKHKGSMSARQLDIVVEWANGGTPEGVPTNHAPVEPMNSWSLGEPSFVLEMPAPFTLPAEVSETTRDFVMPTAFNGEVMIRAVDFRPGTAAIVRSAILYVDLSGEAVALDAADPVPGFDAENPDSLAGAQILTAWLPGQEAIDLDQAAYVVPVGAELVLRLNYKKTWTYEGLEVDDRSVLALYAADPGAARVESIVLQPPTESDSNDGPVISFSSHLSRDLDLLAILPNLEADALGVQIEAVGIDGKRTPVIRLASPRPEWRTRYWLDEPLRLARGTTLEVQAILRSGSGEGNASVSFTLDLLPTQTPTAESN
tara:strand:- start:901 stop:2124 length:1224 start_codon:yes stop_codon:yes gene_type:complete